MDRRSKLKDGEKGESVASAADVVNALRLRDFIHDAVAVAAAATNTIDQPLYLKKGGKGTARRRTLNHFFSCPADPASGYDADAVSVVLD
ncbi:hypothetical protein BO79DRAFT_233222 [Aspergillus costaricaensis CBS 115574]|uniref:Uncharacterized protein n=1 Tax=Aspergillus costaricaensis CBS 115574 TaxID=1448317 RepID=A0ACD1HZW6_9EURO|nr:hypothetical protein BO79DRAFT_233222 [Aspergillus costaricaensis CBS 115574]RAK83590.1 hypothetical protein BO79DRAFT_233222 [Aspergillus costaricaensis CBS 115574]